jgi:hypothetical protein
MSSTEQQRLHDHEDIDNCIYEHTVRTTTVDKNPLDFDIECGCTFHEAIMFRHYGLSKVLYVHVYNRQLCPFLPVVACVQ